VSETRPTLMAVHAHPDDEAIGTGGTFLRYHDLGVRTVLVMCTRGECGEISDPALATPDNLGEVRTRELEEAVGLMRVDRLVWLGYRDSGMAGTPENENPTSFHKADLDEAVGRLVRVVREERPQVLVTYEAKGSYGHPDHIKAHQITVAAFEAAGDPSRFREAGPAWRPGKLYYIVRPRSRTEALLRAAREAGIDGLFGARTEEQVRERLERFGTPDEEVTTQIEIGPYYDQKRAAVLAHRTQMGPKSFFQRMPVEISRRLGTHEYFQRAAGPAPEAAAGERESDLFAGL